MKSTSNISTLVPPSFLTQMKDRILNSWESYIRLICGFVVLILLIVIIIKFANSSFLPDVKIEILLLALAVSILIPYISQFEALGVKVSVREKVDKLSESISALAKAHSYYSLGSEYQEEEDYISAEKYYTKSLDEDPSYWPSLLGLGSIYQNWAEENDDADEYSKAIDYYKQVLKLDEDNLYAYHNLSSIYLNGPTIIRNTEKALEFADKALEIVPSFYDAIFFKGWALNYLKQPEKYEEAENLLQEILDNEKLEDDKHWVMYELYVARSNRDKRIKPDELDEMFDSAEEYEVEQDLIELLNEHDEQARFSKTDLPTIQKFINKHRDLLEEEPAKKPISTNKPKKKTKN